MQAHWRFGNMRYGKYGNSQSWYVYPRLSKLDFGFVRILGPGLGNLLFPWARSVTVAHHFNFKKIFPTWPQLKLGASIRRERDKRFYAGLFQPTGNYVHGWRKLAVLVHTPRISEEEFFEEDKHLIEKTMRIVEFQGMGGGFVPILDAYELIRQELLSITRMEHRRALEFGFGKSIVIHVRRGDFLPPDPERLQVGAWNVGVPMDWYVATVEEIRREFGRNVATYVISDAEDCELHQLLKLGNTRRLQFGSSIADLIALSRSKMLIASGSTFGMWASYLGRMPALYYPGQLKQCLYIERPEWEAEWKGSGRLPSQVIDGFKEMLALETR